MEDAHRAIELAVRTSYGRLVAYLAARSRDVGAAEDALAEVFVAALEVWPRSGVPNQPEAWLLAAARRRMIDAARHAGVRERAAEVLRWEALRAAEAAAEEAASRETSFPDERLRLLLVCAHPAIDAGARTPLMLQTVLGLDAAAIASAFLAAPAAMGQRLVRAKAKIRDAGLRFELPGPEDLPARLEAVLEAIYAAYGSGWEDASGADPRRRGLTEEAIWLGRLVHQLLPGEPEAAGLLALMLHCEARREARRDGEGRYIPLTEQDVARWSWPLIEEAERILTGAARAGRPGRFQWEAAIQSVHVHRAYTGRTDWEMIARLYEPLITAVPSVGGLVARAAAVAEARGAEAGLAALEAVPAEAVTTYQPYWSLRAHLLQRLGRLEESRHGYSRAIGLTEDPAVRDFLVRRREQVRGPDPARI